jgi:hypothetical protein
VTEFTFPDRPEHWLPVPGWEGLYDVSDKGRVRSLDRIVQTSLGPRRYRGCVLKQFLLVRPGAKHWTVVLTRPGTRKTYFVHQIEMAAFAGPCPEGQECRHGAAGSQINWWPENLSYGTHRQNLGEDCLRDGTHRRGERSGLHKLTEQEVLEIRQRAEDGESQRNLARCFGVHFATINAVVLRKNWAWLE